MTAPSPAAAGWTDEDVERVARAIWEGLPDSGYGRKPWPDLSRSTHYLYRTMAAAALAEMRPTAAEEAVKRVEARRCSRGYSEAEHWVDGYYSCPAALAPVPHDAAGGERR